MGRDSQSQPQRGHLRRVLWLALIVLPLIHGCGRVTQFSPENHRLLDELRTAVGTKRLDWLDATAEVANARHDDDQLSDDEYAAVTAIIEQARAGQWTEASAAALQLEKGQRSAVTAPRPVKSRRKPAEPHKSN